MGCFCPAEAWVPETRHFGGDLLTSKTKSGRKAQNKREIHDLGDPDPGNHGTLRRFEHGGGAVGSSSVLIIYPDQKVVIAWLQNSDDFRDWPVLKVAAPFFADRREAQPTESKSN
jgi:hypothetical protein